MSGASPAQGARVFPGLAPDTKLTSDGHELIHQMREPMPLSPPANPGQSFAEIDTPALIIDLDAFESWYDAAWHEERGLGEAVFFPSEVFGADADEVVDLQRQRHQVAGI